MIAGAALALLFLIGITIYALLGPFRPFFWNLPYLTGFLGPRNYLILIQNNNELRPTGGFITGVAELSMLFGFSSLEVFDSYQIPDPSPRLPAPEPFQYLIGTNDTFFAGKTLRDANFSPDFRESSEEVLELYKIAYPEKTFDMVIAVDFAVIENLLDLYGQLSVEDLIFTRKNFFDLTQKISKDIDTHNKQQLEERKGILGPFGKKFVKRIISSPTKYPQFLSALETFIQEKNLIAYSPSESFQAKLSKHALTGLIRHEDPNTDFLHVNVANIGGRKADRYVTKEIKYMADFSNPENPASTLDITFSHLGSYNIQSDIYQAYVRSYVPLGSKLVSPSPTGMRGTENFQDLGQTVFADAIKIAPGESITLSYKYQLPEIINPQEYQLQVPKQPGIQNQFWQTAFKQQNDTLLENEALKNIQITPMTIRENLALWKGIPSSDLHFSILTSGDASKPIILWQKFESLNRINIRFNEILDESTVYDLKNYRVTDLNKEDIRKDTVVVTGARFEGRDLWLDISGASLQYLENYELKISNLKDTQGNTLDPNPTIRTLVQRLEATN